MVEQNQSILLRYTHDLLASEKMLAQVLKDHPQIPFMIDVLSRKENHHIALKNVTSNKIITALLASISLGIIETLAPQSLRSSLFFYFDIQKLMMESETAEEAVKRFVDFYEAMTSTNKRIILVLNQFLINDHFKHIMNRILHNDQWRIILTRDHSIEREFVTIDFIAPSDSQLVSLLQFYKTELEHFHQVTIYDETLPSALSMAAHYLPQFSFDKVIELLDSAAARASVTERSDSTSTSPQHVVTMTTLAQTISNWTQIPVTHINNNVFQMTKFVESLQRNVYGQDAAISLIGSVLQQACIKLQGKKGPLCNFLFVGPTEAGKTTAALSMAEHLFGQKDAFLRVNLSEHPLTLNEIRTMSETNQSKSLLSAIQKIPYAIVLLENIHQLPATTFQLFKNILVHGYALDEQGNKCDFSHAIIVMTTNLGADKIATLTQAPTVHDTNKTLDLMQLVMSEHSSDSNNQIQHQISTHDLCEELIPTLESHFSSSLLQHMHIVPFIPLDYASVEKIIRQKVKSFVKHLHTQLQIELTYAPEVIKFLAHEALWRKANIKPLEKLLEQYLYTPVANELLAHADDSNRSNRLLLQLNAEGQLLRCEFITAIGTAAYS